MFLSEGDLRVLRHDKSVLHPLRKLDHLKHIPDYLMPTGLQTGEDPTQVRVLVVSASWFVQSVGPMSRSSNVSRHRREVSSRVIQHRQVV